VTSQGRFHRLGAGLHYSDHGASAHRTGATKSSSSVSEGDRHGILGFPPVPALHAQTLALTVSGGGEKGTGAHIGSLLLGSTAGTPGGPLLGGRLVEFCQVREAGKAEAREALCKTVHIPREVLGEFRPQFLELADRPFSAFATEPARGELLGELRQKHPVLLVERRAPLPALVGEVMAASAEEGMLPAGEIELTGGPIAARAEKRDPLRAKGSDRAPEQDGVEEVGFPRDGRKHAYVKNRIFGGSWGEPGGPGYRARPSPCDAMALLRGKDALSGELKCVQDQALFHRSFGHLGLH